MKSFFYKRNCRNFAVLVGLSVLFLAGFNNTPFYPSGVDPQSSLTLANASSSHFTLTVMSYVALAVPVVLAYIAFLWHRMDRRKLTMAELRGDEAKILY